MKKTPRGRAALCAVGIALCLVVAAGVMYVMVDPARTGRMLSDTYWGIAGWLTAIAYPLIVGILLCAAFLACLRVTAEAIYCLVNDRRGIPYGLCMLVVSLAAAAGTAASMSEMIAIGIRYGLVPLAIAVILVAIVARCVSRHADITSLTVDATRYGMIPYQPYELASRRSFPLGILPTYRGMRRAIRRMQSIGTRPETFLAIGSERDAADVVSALPSGSPLGEFVTSVINGMPDNDVRYPFGIGRVIDVDDKRFAIASSKKLAHTTNIEIVPADEFCESIASYSWLVRQTFVVRNADGTMPKRHAPMHTALHEKGKVMPMSDGTSVIVPPDKSSVIPIDQSTVVPVIKPNDAGDTGLIHADVSSLVDMDGGTSKAKPRRRHKPMAGRADANASADAGDAIATDVSKAIDKGKTAGTGDN